ncbi:MAG: glycerophosphodiester phosphodiesterase [Myxococcota bacterium]
MYPDGPMVIAHRGASADRPENTRSAYALALEQGADMIEIDLHLSRDGAIVIAHDAELLRIGGRGEIGDADVAAIRELDAGGGEPVPVLEEVLDEFGPRTPFNLELKQRDSGPYAGLVERAVAAVRERGWMDRMLFSSFYDPLLHELRDRAPEARIGLLVSRRFPHGALERAAALGAEALHPERPLATGDLIQAAHAAGLRVHVFTVNEEDALRSLLEAGADACFTDHPARMRSVVDSLRGSALSPG